MPVNQKENNTDHINQSFEFKISASYLAAKYLLNKDEIKYEIKYEKEYLKLKNKINFDEKEYTLEDFKQDVLNEINFMDNMVNMNFPEDTLNILKDIL